MNMPIRLLSMLLSIAFVAAACANEAPSTSTSVAQSTEKTPLASRWLSRPWETRYWLEVIRGNWQTMRQGAIRRNAKPKDADFPDSDYLAIFSPLYIFQTFGEKETTSVIAIEFDKQGHVISPNENPRPLTGRIATIGPSLYVYLSEGDFKGDNQYDLGKWFHGFGDSSVEWAPTICSSGAWEETPSPFSATDDTYKYGPKFNLRDTFPIFGCREWTYQLYDDARPYIDVTSYAPKTKSHPHGTYIRDFVGWARFGDKKPVIGKDADTWYCLYDCPDGDKPGPIVDIKTWTSQHGWPMPKRPTRVPTFPDPPAKQGEYR